MSALNEQALTISSVGLRLEGRLHAGAPSAPLALVLHPHPLYGGDMDNHVVTAICGALAESGATTLRFNSRGTGRSDGRFDKGRGERADAFAAATLLRDGREQWPLLLCGYSFGAVIAADTADAIRPDGMLLVSPPFSDAMALRSETAVAVLITGEHDQIAPPDALRPLENDRTRLVIVPGVDHGWWGGMAVLEEEVRQFVKALSITNPANA